MALASTIETAGGGVEQPLSSSCVSHYIRKNGSGQGHTKKKISVVHTHAIHQENTMYQGRTIFAFLHEFGALDEGKSLGGILRFFNQINGTPSITYILFRSLAASLKIYGR